VFFDVDFTLIHPGPRFQSSGYRESCARHGIVVDEGRFDEACVQAAAVLDDSAEAYDAGLYVAYTRRIIEAMGGTGPALDRVSREIYDEWAQHAHFSLYDDVADALRELRARDVRLGLISNSHRCLVSCQSHFELDGLIDVAVSSSDYGVMKPHPPIFQRALSLMDVRADEAVMVGDSVSHDVNGARRVGMRPILVVRGGATPVVGDDVTVVRSLAELPELVAPAASARG
jgi:HAD superfamily hydrolase (TIGR01662 family)